LLWQILATLSYFAGYYSPIGIRWGRHILISIDVPWSSKRLRVILSLMVIIGCASYLILTSRAGGPIAFARQMAVNKRQIQELATFLRGVALLPTVAIFWFVYYLTQKKSLLFLVYCLSVLLILGTLSSRSLILFPAISFFILFHYLNSHTT